jgi:tRNA-2-methylthio-N6-dimethylallyladenosine synthase
VERLMYLATFGCQMNEYDSERMVRLMAEEGYAQTADMEQADFILLNTCSIREKAELKVYSYLGRLRKLKERKPELIIGLSGCVAQQEGENLLKNIPHLDLVVGTHGVHRLPGLVEDVRQHGKQVCRIEFDYHLPTAPETAYAAGPVKAFLTIMQGCDNFCSYCVVPYVRGRETSRPPEDIQREAEGLLAQGVREITLLGQNVNSYGQGLAPATNFTELIERISNLRGLYRLRFTTSHPKDLSPELIRALAETETLCEHIHLPAQSGSSSILKAMGRKYTREDYLRRVDALRGACPEVAISTDIIIGFPGETDADYRQTMDLLQRVQFDGIYSFKYSDRPMTRASRSEDKIPDDMKSERLSALQALQKEITLAKNKALVGTRAEVLVEGPSRRMAGQMTGRTRTNRIVNFSGPEDLSGRLEQATILEAYANSLRGELCSREKPGVEPDFRL